MQPPKIGFTSREADISYFHQWQHDYWFSLTLASAHPVRIYPSSEGDVRRHLDSLDGLMLTGGGDIDPALYHQALNGTDPKSIFPERDRFEIDLVREAIHHRLPVLGICRGLQLINVALGGTLTQHVHGHTGKTNSFEGPSPHMVTLRGGSLAQTVLACGDSVMVNSYHHQAVTSSDLAPPLRASGIAADGVIEAVEHPQHPWLLAVQWHPERLYELGSEHRHLFDRFVEAARRYQMERTAQF